MKFVDKTKKPVEGYFKIETYKDGVLIDTYEDNNMIMLNSKNTMRNAMAGQLTQDHADPANVVNVPIMINTFMLGTKGHVGDNILIPESFDYTKDGLFSMEPSDPGKIHPITWSTDANASPSSRYEGYDSTLNSGFGSGITMNLTTDSENKIIEYIFNIPESVGNDSGNAIAYTEAALYSNLGQIIDGTAVGDPNNAVVTNYGSIFAMRTFPAKIKDAATSFKITWRIIY